jgi:hypothetical protein
MGFVPNLIGYIQDNTDGNDTASLTFAIMASFGILTAFSLLVADYTNNGGIL